MKKPIIIFIILAILGGAGYWYAQYMGWLSNYGPDNLPTAEERQRMQEVERASAEIAPDAKAGAGVFLKGTLPPKAVEESASSTNATTTTSTQPKASSSTATTS